MSTERGWTHIRRTANDDWRPLVVGLERTLGLRVDFPVVPGRLEHSGVHCMVEFIQEPAVSSNRAIDEVIAWARCHRPPSVAHVLCIRTSLTFVNQ